MDKEQFYFQHYKKQKDFLEAQQKDLFTTSDRYRKFLNLIKKHSPKIFLDIGCSEGSFSAAVKNETGCEVFGIDISEEAVKASRAKGVNASLVDIDSSALPFDNNFFDCIFCGEVIEHVHNPDHLLEELRRVLKPGGFLLLTTPNMAAWFNRFSLLFGFQPLFSEISYKYSCGQILHIEPAGHLRLYTLRALKGLMELYKFKIIKTYGIGVNHRIGFGKAHPFMARVANLIFQSSSWNSGILVIATK